MNLNKKTRLNPYNGIILRIPLIFTLLILLFNLILVQQLFSQSKKINISFNNTSIDSVIKILSEKLGKNIVKEPDVNQSITADLRNVTPEHALKIILKTHNLNSINYLDTIVIMTPESYESRGIYQQNEIRVIQLKNI